MELLVLNHNIAREKHLTLNECYVYSLFENYRDGWFSFEFIKDALFLLNRSDEGVLSVLTSLLKEGLIEADGSSVGFSSKFRFAG